VKTKNCKKNPSLAREERKKNRFQHKSIEIEHTLFVDDFIDHQDLCVFVASLFLPSHFLNVYISRTNAQQET
jgi:hypothetical protein